MYEENRESLDRLEGQGIMAARKLTRDPHGEICVFSTKRGKPDMCSENCSGVYSFRGELYCKYFGCVVGKRSDECIKNEIGRCK